MAISTNSPVDIQPSVTERPTVPPWFAEVVILARHLTHQGLIEALCQRVHLARGRLGRYEIIDFIALLVGYAISGEPTLEAFFARLAPFAAAFMALFGRSRLPHRATLSRFLAAMDRPCLEALRHLFEQDICAREWVVGGLWDRQGQQRVLFDVDGTRQVARQRTLPQGEDLPPAQRRFEAVCAKGYCGRKRGEVVRTRTVICQAHTQQWIGTFSGAGNGEYRAELTSACQAITAYLQAKGLPLEAGVVRLDGLYGDAAVLAQLGQTGLQFVLRGRNYRLLSHPDVQFRLRQPDHRALHPPESQVSYAVFDVGTLWIEEAQRQCRVVVSRRAAPPTGTPLSIGKQVGEYVYELFLTSLSSRFLLPEDVLALYHHRGAFESVLADEDQEQDADRWCSHQPCGQEFWQVVSQWVWNLRLEFGHLAQPKQEERWTLWAPAPTGMETLPTVVQEEPPRDTQEGYGPLEWAEPRGSRRGCFAGSDFLLQSDRTLCCPAGKSLRFQEQRLEAAGLRLIFIASAADCASCQLRQDCLGPQTPLDRPRRVSALRRLPATVLTPLTPPLPTPFMMQALLWSDLAARSLRRSWVRHLRQQLVEMASLPAAQAPQPPEGSPTMRTRAQAAHRRRSWTERLGGNAFRPEQPRVRCSLFGLPAHVARYLGLSSPPAG